ncbi:CsiV family protein [Aliikangiella sp. G2MR2-5]|uniref:CsiV family protein n=1 Tax=Aliikangiella sp. G2MR2-5 TaxID=2788943 RepID=UPI0018A8FE69|nr:CsiV family protein [Aliikangiella sp. G2MR2-5]
MILFKKAKYISLVLAGIASSAISAEESDPVQDGPKWYQVEVVLFKSESLNALSDESWDPETKLELSTDFRDFLQPYRVINGQPSAEFEDLIEQEIVSQPVSSDSSIATNTDNNLAFDADAGELEVPFQLLPESQLSLNNEVKSLQKNPEYNVLFHIGWKQPVLSSNEARSIRIAGGRDYSLDYLYDGEKRQAGLNLFSSPTDSDDFTASDENFLTNNSGSDFNEFSSNNESKEEEVLPSMDTIEPTLWVPEIDGDIKIYVARYLHVKTNLYLRRPDKFEIEAIDLDLFKNDEFNVLKESNPVSTSLSDNQSVFTSDTFNEASQLDKTKTVSDNLALLQSQAEKQGVMSDINQNHKFSWEIDDDFLNSESQKLYKERLFNYSMKQARRMRSGELHYFDHPLFGMLILITPIELNEEEPSVPPSF